MEDNVVLDDIKKLLGLPKEYDAFNRDVKIHVNSVFSTLHQLGVGPSQPFRVESPDDTWGMFTQEKQSIENVKTYVYLRVRLLFDPPAHAFLLTAVQDQIKELEWRLMAQAEEGRVVQNGT